MGVVSTGGRRPVSVLREIKRNGMTNGTLTTRLRGRREREQSILTICTLLHNIMYTYTCHCTVLIYIMCILMDCINTCTLTSL